MKAIEVLNAARDTFETVGNEDYAIGKANNFLRRCLIGFEDKGPEQEIDIEIIKRVAYAMLDEETEKTFWACLGVVK